MQGCRIQLKTVVGRQGRIVVLFPGMGAKAVFYGDLVIVKDNLPGYASKVLKHPHQCLQKAFLVLPAICQNHGRTAVAQVLSRVGPVDKK